MKVDIYLPVFPLESIAQTARQAEEMGFDGFWVGESTHNPFIALALAATATRRILLGTDVAVAFARSPQEIGERVRERYEGIADRVALYGRPAPWRTGLSGAGFSPRG
jgi:alkanesulfonate monooxygenase SsuD/methylene tetrahydromethanopterin reductase-like flavin-dependent oxidoreductase (luciferase family)